MRAEAGVLAAGVGPRRRDRHPPAKSRFLVVERLGKAEPAARQNQGEGGSAHDWRRGRWRQPVEEVAFASKVFAGLPVPA